MTFVNAWITPEDVEKYHLDQDYERSKGRIGIYTNLEIIFAGRGPQWTVDKENGSYLRYGGTGNRALGIGQPRHRYFLFKWEKYYLFPDIKREKNNVEDDENKIAFLDVYLMNEFIPSNIQSDKEETIKDLKEALTCYGEVGLKSNWLCELTFKF